MNKSSRSRSHANALLLPVMLLLAASPAAFATTPASVSAQLSSATPYYTDNVSATVTITGSGGPAPTGSVTFSTDTEGQQSVPVNNSIARLNLKFFAPGAHTLTYTYSGDSNYSAPPAKTLNFTVVDRPFAIASGESIFFTSPILQNLYNVALDSKHNLYIVDANDNLLYKSDIARNVTTVPTNGLTRPDGIVLDATDNIFLADSGNARVVEINASGIQTTLPITGLIDPIAVAFDHAYSTLYIADQGNGNIVEYDIAAKTQKVVATDLSPLTGIAVDPSGNMYLAAAGGSSGTDDVYLLDTAGNLTELYIGVPVPGNLALRNGNLFINSNLGVFEYDTQGHLTQLSYGKGGISTVNGDVIPLGLAVDTLGNIYYNGGGLLNLLVPGTAANAGVSPTGRESGGAAEFTVYYQVAYQQTAKPVVLAPNAPISIIGNNFTGPTFSPINTPFLWSSELYSTPQVPGPFSTLITVTDSDNVSHTALVYGVGQGSELAIAPGNVTQQSVSAASIGGIAQDANRVPYITDPGGNQVLELSATPTTLPFTGLNQPTQIAVDGAGAVYVLDSGNARILKLDSSKKQTVAFALSSQTALTSLESFTIDGGANLYLSGQAKSGGSAIYYLDSLGNQTLVATNIAVPDQLLLDGLGDVFSLESANGILRKFDAAGNPSVFVTGLTGAVSAAVDPSGTTYIAGASGSGITIVKPDGTTTQYPMAALANASAVAVDGGGNLAVGDSSGKQIFSILREQTVSSVYNYAFGNVPKGSTKTIPGFISNVGNLASQTFQVLIPANGTPSSPDFAFTSGGGACVSDGTNSNPALGIGDSCGLSLAFTPSVAGSQTTGTFGPLNIFQMIATGTESASTQPAITITPSAIVFPSTPSGSTSPSQTLTVQNTGAATANISSITLIGANSAAFALTSGCTSTLAVNTSCSLTVSFSPTAAAQSDSASVSVVSDDPSSPATAALSGSSPAESGPQPVLTPAIINFGSVAVGSTSATKTATLTNKGGVPQAISSFGFFGTNTSSFSETNTCGSSVAAGASCTIAITCSPTTADSLTANLGANFPSPQPQLSIALTCAGAAATPPPAPGAALTPATADFGSMTSGTTSTARTFTLTNPGNAVLTITGITLGGSNLSDFAISANNCGGTLAAGATCTVSVTFTPSAIGSFAASLSVADNAAGSPQTSTLAGTGTVPANFTIAASPAVQTVSAGAAAAYSISISSTDGSFTNPVALKATGLPPGATVNFLPATVTPGSSAAQSSMSIQTTTQQAGIRKHPAPWPFAAPVFTCLLLLLPARRFRQGKHGHKFFTQLACIIALVGVGVSAIGCGGGFALPSTAKTYTITVTGTSGSDNHSTTVTLTVQ
jgi:sugar lactone lactonase YvrE